MLIALFYKDRANQVFCVFVIPLAWTKSYNLNFII